MQLRTDLRRAFDYDSALALFEDINPVPEHYVNGGFRPLAMDRQSPRAYNIRTYPRGTDKPREVRMRLHDTDVVTWCPDGTVKIDTGGWKTRSTCTFIEKTTPVGARLSHDRVILDLPGWGTFIIADADSSATFRIEGHRWVPTKPHMAGVVIGPGQRTLEVYKPHAEFVRRWHVARKHVRPFYEQAVWETRMQDRLIGWSIEQRAPALAAEIDRLIHEHNWVPGDDIPGELLRYAPPYTGVFRMEAKRLNNLGQRSRVITTSEAAALVRDGQLSIPTGINVV